MFSSIVSTSKRNTTALPVFLAADLKRPSYAGGDLENVNVRLCLKAPPVYGVLGGSIYENFSDTSTIALLPDV